MSNISFDNPIQLWTFVPKEDLTIEELVDMVKAIAPALNMQLTNNSTYDSMPENVKRHFAKRPMSNNTDPLVVEKIKENDQ